MYTKKIIAPQFRRKLLDKSDDDPVHGGIGDSKRESPKDSMRSFDVNNGQRFWYPGDLPQPEERKSPDLSDLKEEEVTDRRNIPVFVRGKKFTKP